MAVPQKSLAWSDPHAACSLRTRGDFCAIAKYDTDYADAPRAQKKCRAYGQINEIRGNLVRFLQSKRANWVV